MFKTIKNWFGKMDCKVGCCNTLYGTKETYQDVVIGNPALTLEEQTYKIFKTTPIHSAIPQEAQSGFFKHCKDLLKDEILERVIDEVVGEFAESIIQTADNEKTLFELRNKMLGAEKLRTQLQTYASSFTEEEKFDQNEPI